MAIEVGYEHGGLRGSLVDCLRDQQIPPARSKASPGNQETSRWDSAGHADNRPWITFLTRELFVFKCFVTLVASAMFVLVSTDQSQLSFQMGHGSEVGSPDPTSSSPSRSHI